MGRFRAVVLGLFCVAVSVVADVAFLRHQTLWNDEYTQLQGLTLDPVEMTRWLVDQVNYDFGVSDDRMPPLSYWLGWGWSRVFGLREVPMRWLSITCMAGAVAIVFATAYRAWGAMAGVAAGLLVATSPNAVALGIEIRAYALLVLTSAATFASLMRFAEAPVESRKRWLVALVVCGLLAAYSHFFGLVALGGALLAAFVISWRRGESVVPVLVAGVVVGLASLGLVPFIRASVGLSNTAPVPPGIGQKISGLVKLVYRLFSHPSTSVSQVAVGLAAVGFGLGLACGLAPRRAATATTLGLGVALGSGLAVVSLAHLVQSSFVASSPIYNGWMIPALALFVAGGLTAQSALVRRAAGTAITLSLLANLYGTGQLAARGDWFAHTSYGAIDPRIRELGPDRVAIVHDNNGVFVEGWNLHIPVLAYFKGRVPEFNAITEGDPAGPVLATTYPLYGAKTPIVDLPYDHLIVVRTVVQGAAELADQIHSGIVPIGDGPATRALLESGRWKRVEEIMARSFYGIDVDVFRRVAAP